jgi:hypothetical protein
MPPAPPVVFLLAAFVVFVIFKIASGVLRRH